MFDAPTNDDFSASHDMVFQYSYMTISETREKAASRESFIPGEIT